MSFASVYGAATADIPPAPRLVLQCVERHANGAGVWAMTHEDIAWEMRLSRETVRLAVALLIREGYLAVQRFARRRSVFHVLKHETPRNYRDRVGYQHDIEDEPSPAMQEAEIMEQSEVSTQDPAPNSVHAQDPAPNDKVAPQDPAPNQRESAIVGGRILGVQSPTVREERKNQQEDTTPESVSPRDVVVDDGPSVARKILDTWNGIAEVTGLHPEPVNDLRELQVAQWLRGVKLDDAIAALAKIRDTPFLRGEVTGWQANLQWLMKPGHVHRVLTTSYKQHEPRKTAYQQKQADYADTLRELGEFFDNMGAKPYATQEHSA